ncbi:MAG: tetratricopeptide repeat protein [Alphaproteobacteria bacterium]|nr:tetratricopeptide repeat protein [Alphaproteobacteria bacterium]
MNATLDAAIGHFEAGRLDEAEAACRAILATDAAQPDALFLLGVIAHRRGRNDEAVTRIEAAIARNRRNPLYRNALGVALAVLGRSERAIAAFRDALALAPQYADAYVNLGNALEKRGALAAAIDCFRRAIAIEPTLATAHFNLGNALLAQGDAAAIDAYRRAIALKPNFADAHMNLGAVLRRQGQPQEAAACFRRAVALRPDYAEAYDNLAGVLAEIGQLDEAVAANRRALELGPASAAAHSNLLFNLNFDESLGVTEHQAERRRWAERHAAALAPATAPRSADLDPERRLRVGYVSAHFRAYAASYAFGGVLTHHDPAQVEVFCYSDTRQADELTAIFRRAAATWRETAGLSDAALAERIAQDRIDILVDLVGHMGGHRLLVFARKPAPIQITAWGEPTGTGLAMMDYLLADPVLIPPAERPLFAERIIDLPGALGYWTPEKLPAPGPLPVRANGFVTFGSFNRRAKITPGVLRDWSAILRALPDARLVLKNKQFGDPAEQTELRTAFAAADLPAERVTFLGQTGRAEHFAAYRALDIALDPFPHGGGMTTLDALAMGVPVITRTGRTIPSRLAASCLTALDLMQFIATDAAGYVAAAVATAGDLDALERLRAALPGRLAHSAIGDARRYAAAVEDVYRTAWRRYCTEAAARQPDC